ncbi:hypothetical protein [Paraburkholderia diazotrophica]|uniref:hypothetical protein n=1 Tax=Paraburkholderia diazotrophica TaxID=667676 RepID=UPI003D182F44
MRAKKTMPAAALVVTAALSDAPAGCAHTARMTYLPSGGTGFAINFIGSDACTSWVACHKQAGECAARTATT